MVYFEKTIGGTKSFTGCKEVIYRRLEVYVYVEIVHT